MKPDPPTRRESEKGSTESSKKYKKKVHYTHYVHGDYYRFALNSCYIFSVKNRFRTAIVWFVQWRPFDWAIILLILLNSIFLGMQDYVNP